MGEQLGLLEAGRVFHRVGHLILNYKEKKDTDQQVSRIDSPVTLFLRLSSSTIT